MPASWLRSLSRRKAAGRVAELLPYLPQTGRLLDFGCGSMALTCALGAALPRLEVVGLDVLPEPPRDGRPANVSYVRYDGAHIPFPEGRFDASLAAAALHHAASVDGALREMLRVTRVGGVVIVLDDSFTRPLRRAVLHAEHVVRNVALGIPVGRLNFQSEAEWQAHFRRLPVEVRAARWVRPFSYVLDKRLFCLVRTAAPSA